MSKDFLAGRERALEDEFFYRVDQQLRADLQAKMKAEEDSKRLAAETGIRDQAVIAELVELGITPDTLLALSLIPLLQVAWADRIVDEKQRAAILRAAEEKGRIQGTASYQMLEHWLEEAPGEKALHAWKAYVGAICQSMSAEGVAALGDDVISHAHEVATAAGGILGIGAISQKEQAVLDDLQQTFAGGSTA